MNIRRLLPFVCAKATWSEVISTISLALVRAYYLDLHELELNDVDMILYKSPARRKQPGETLADKNKVHG